MLTVDQLKTIIQGETPADITSMRKQFSDYCRHFFGTNTTEYLTAIGNLENDKQVEYRRKHAIKNPWIVDELLRPIDNIWQAKGGDEKYEFSGTDQSEDFREKLKDVRSGMSMHSFMKEIWFQRFISDPGGVIFLEVSEDGTKAYYTYKSITRIKAYKSNGIKLDWIIFEPDVTLFQDEKKEVKIEYSWAVDEANYYRCKNDGKEFVIEEKRPHSFKQVPGIINSTIYDTEKATKVSLIDKQVDLLNSFLTKNSVKEIYQYKHNYAIPWSFPVLCGTCNGTRKIGDDICPDCKGSGYSLNKDVTEVKIVPKPDMEVSYPIPPMGYVQPSVETCTENRTELDWMFDKMFHSLWGTTTSKMDESKPETATGRYIDTMPVYNKLNYIADIAQAIERQLIIIFGKYFYSETFKDAKKSYSRRYIIESPDALWKRYSDARAAKSPEMSLNYMLEQFYYSEFASNQAMADYYIKLMYVEPYVHSTIAEVELMQVEDQLKASKRYFPQWIATLDPLKVETKSTEQLITDLNTYSKTKNNGKTTEPEGPEPGAGGKQGTKGR